MAKFIEVKPFNFGGEQHRILINVEKIDYVQELEGGCDINTSIGCPTKLFW